MVTKKKLIKNQKTVCGGGGEGITAKKSRFYNFVCYAPYFTR